jgi:hypothetical protein
MLQLSAFWPHLGASQAASSLPVVWGGHRLRECPEKQNSRVSQPAAIVTCKTGNRRTQQVTEIAIMQNRNYRAEGTYRRQNRGWHGGRSSRNKKHLIDHSQLRSSESAKTITTKKQQFSAKNTHQTQIKSQVSAG